MSEDDNDAALAHQQELDQQEQEHDAIRGTGADSEGIERAQKPAQ